MRVLMVSGFYVLDGSSIVVENLAKQLSKNDVDITIGAIAFKRVPPSGNYNRINLPLCNPVGLKKLLDDFDVVHSHHPFTNYLALITRKPFIYHFHGAPSIGKGNIFKFSMLSSFKFTMHQIDRAITISDVATEELRKYLKSDKIQVLYNGVDATLFRPDLEKKFRKGSPQLLFVGNLYEHKNVEELFLALKLLTKTYPMIHLQVVGDGEGNQKLRQLIIDLKLQNHVELVGRVSRFDLPHYYASSDVYVTASRWELFGLPLLEAMACGKPIVASSIPSHHELLIRSKAGKIYQIGNVQDMCIKIIQVCVDSESYKKNAINFARKNDWSVVTNKLLCIYNDVINIR